MRIEDDELREIFKVASEEHLQNLEAGILHLEQHPGDRDRLKTLLRDAHSLKGDAGMLGVKDVQTLTHQLEHLLKGFEAGDEAIAADLFDRLYGGLDAIRRLAREAVTGDPSGVNTFHILAYLMGAKSEPGGESGEGEGEPGKGESSEGEPSPVAPAPAEAAPAATESEPAESDATEPDATASGATASGATASGAAASGAAEPDAETAEPEEVAPAANGCPAALPPAAAAKRLQTRRDIPASPDPTGPQTSDRDASPPNAQGVPSPAAARPPGDRAASPSDHRPAAIAPTSATSDNGHPAASSGSEQSGGEQSGKDGPGRDSSTYRIDTIRVATRHLDNLMTQAGELTVTKIRIARRQSQLEDLLSLWEDWSRDAFAHRFIFSELLRDSGAAGAILGRGAEVASSRLANGDTARTAPRPAGTNGSSNGSAASAPAYGPPYGQNGQNPLRPSATNGAANGTSLLQGRFANARGLDGTAQGAGSSPLGNTLDRLQAFHQRLEARLERLGTLVESLQGATQEDTARLEAVADGLESGIRTLRLLPLSTIFNLFPRMVRDLAKAQGKRVRLVVEGDEAKADKHILEAMKDPLMHAIRNAIDHGLETPEDRQRSGKSPEGTIWLRGFQTATSIAIEVADDGRGLDVEGIRRTALQRKLRTAEELDAMTPAQIHGLIFAPGFSTRRLVTEVSGRGVGLDVVRANVERLKGTVRIESEAGRGSTLRIQLSTTLATAHVLLVSVHGVAYGIPVEFVETIRLLAPEDLFSIEGQQTLAAGDRSVSVVELASLLELGYRPDSEGAIAAEESETGSGRLLPCTILKVGEERLGVLVDALLDEQDVVLKPQSKLLKRVRNVSGATILGTGEVCPILDPPDLVKSAQRQAGSAGSAAPVEAEAAARKPTVLLVEDSIATRTQEKRILEGAGYAVVTAVDGLEGYNKLTGGKFDAVVSDVQMPNLDGLALTERIRKHREYSELPVILVTTLASDSDRQRGADAGANAYITKGNFDSEVLLETLRRLI